MRSLLVSMFVALALSRAVGAQQSIVPDGRRLALGTYCYEITANTPDGPKPRGVTFQSIQRTMVHGVDALAIVVHQRLLDGRFDMRDSFLLAREDLRPISLDTERDGKPHAHLDYKSGRVIGWKMHDGARQAIDVLLKGPVWEGNLWGETFAALPLTKGASLTLPTYQYDSGLGSFNVEVVDRSVESTPLGSEDSWILKAGLAGSRQVEYSVAVAPGLELGYAAGPSSQRLGGDCGNLR